MAEVNWNLAARDAFGDGLNSGLSYGQRIAQMAQANNLRVARQSAGQKFATGDIRGAASDLALSGDVEGAAQLQTRQDALDRSHYEFAGRAAGLLDRIYDGQIKAGKTPQEAGEAVLQGYDTLAGQLPSAFGTPEQMAQFRQRLAQDPKGTLTAVSGMVQRELQFQTSDGQTRVYDKNTGDLVRTDGERQIKPPQRNSRVDGDVTIEEQFNPQTGQYEEISRGPRYKPQAPSSGLGKPPAGFKWSGDGQRLEVIPGGPADKLTEGQANAVGYGSRLADANESLTALETKITDADLYKARVPGVGNYLSSPEVQQFEQAKRNFINAQLRRESGAAIADSEFANADKQYFKQPGDSPQVVEQKRRNRERAISSMRLAAGRGGTQIAPAAPQVGAPKPSVSNW